MAGKVGLTNKDPVPLPSMARTAVFFFFIYQDAARKVLRTRLFLA